MVRWRLTQDWSQQELADAAGMSRSQVKDIEGGRNRPSIGTLLKIIHGLDVAGADDELRLSRFFRGPERRSLEDAVADAQESLRSVLRPPGRRRAR